MYWASFLLMVIIYTVDHLDATIDSAKKVAEVPTLSVYDVKSSELDSFSHFVECSSPLLTKIGVVVVCTPKSWKLPSTSMSDDHAGTIRSQWLLHLHPQFSYRTIFQKLCAAWSILMTGQNRLLHDSDAKITDIATLYPGEPLDVPTVVQHEDKTSNQWGIEKLNKGGTFSECPVMPEMNVPMMNIADPIHTFVIIRRMRNYRPIHTRSRDLQKSGSFVPLHIREFLKTSDWAYFQYGLPEWLLMKERCRFLSRKVFFSILGSLKAIKPHSCVTGLFNDAGLLSLPPQKPVMATSELVPKLPWQWNMLTVLRSIGFV